MEQPVLNGAHVNSETENFIHFLQAQHEAQLQYAELTRMNPVDEIKWPSAGPIPTYTGQERATVLHANPEYSPHNQLPSSSNPLSSTGVIPPMSAAVSGMASLSVSNTDLCRPSVVHSSHFLDNYDQFGAQYSQQLLTPFLPPYFNFPSDMDMNSLRPREEHSGLFPKDLETKSMSFPYTQRSHGEEVFLNQMFPYQLNFPVPNTTKRTIKDEAFAHHVAEGESIAHATVTSTTRHSLDCQVCQSTQANGLHFGARTCAACAAFFRRTISDDKKYVCKRSQRCNNPSKDGTGYRKICRACRLKRCMDIGMLPENVQHKRVPTDMPKSSSSLGDQLDSRCFDASHVLDSRHFDPRTFDARNALESSVQFDSMLPFYSHIATNNNNNLQ